MEKTIFTIQPKNKKLEELIRKMRGKPTEPITNMDLAVLKPLIRRLASGTSSGINFNEHLCPKRGEFHDEIGKLAMETGDEQLLRLYKRMDDHKDRRYQKFFGLGILLGVTDIYDIGCGFEWQVGYIFDLKGISYTGIDRAPGFERKVISISPEGSREESMDITPVDFDYYTSLFSEFNGNIQFIHAEYPFEIRAKANNLAIAVGSIGDFPGMEALARDFERVIMTVSLRNEPECRKIFSDFQIMELNRSENKNYFTEKATGDGSLMFFATRYGDEIEYLKNVGFSYYDDRFFVDTVDKTRYLENCGKADTGILSNPS